jgi:hypothetical protein
MTKPEESKRDNGIAEALFVVGGVAFIVGVAVIYWPAALIIAGAILVLAAMVMAK